MDQGNLNFQALLNEFKTIIKGEPLPVKVKEKLDALKQKSKAKELLLTYRQIDAIIARCDNYMKGEYGNTKTKENLSYGLPPE